MSFNEGTLEDKVSSLQAQLAACKSQIEPVLERYQSFKANFGIKEKSNGTMTIDFEKMVARLGPEQSAVLRAVIDEKHGPAEGQALPDVLAQLVGKTVTIIDGGDGKKPKLRVHAKTAA